MNAMLCVFAVLILNVGPADMLTLLDPCLLPTADALLAGLPWRYQEKRCDGDIRFNNAPPFDHLPLPQCAECLKPTMRLFTREDREIGQLMTRDKIPSTFRQNKKTVFFVHGWLGSQYNSYFYDTKNSLLQKEDANAIIVGWEAGSVNLIYRQSASNTRSVGTVIGLMAAKLVENGKTDRMNIECVGHSLGSHICGHAGQRYKLGRITGLDPAGPSFEHKPPSVGLNPDCADYVDAIHTGHNGSLLVKYGPVLDDLFDKLLGLGFNMGISRRVGHVDLYPNGGEIQPQCLDPSSQKIHLNKYPHLFSFVENILVGYVVPVAGIIDVVTTLCSHFASVTYYGDSILSPYYLSRYTCTDYKNLPVPCTVSANPVQSMGYESIIYKANTGIFYLETNSAEPFYKN